MGIITDVILLMLSSIVLFIGIQFFVNNKLTSNKTRYYVLGYSFFSGLWCICYGIIGLIAKFDVAMTLRAIGVLSINGFSIVEVFLLSGMSHDKKRLKIGSRIVAIILGIIDTLIFANPNVAIFVRIRSWTTWVSNPDYSLERQFHSVVIFLYVIIMFFLGVRWYITNPLKRQRKFIASVFVANFLMLFFTLPDTILPLTGGYAIPTSGIGAALCTIVIWYGASILNSFDINVGNVYEKIYKFIDAGVLVFDMDSNLVLSNPFGEKLVPENKKGKIGLDDLFYVDEKDTKDFFFDTSDGIVSRRFEAISDHKIYSLKNSVLIDAYNEPYCYLCVLLDITDEINTMRELETANNAKTKFLTSISHEIRTPINAVLGFSEIISNLSKDEEIISCTDNISRAGDLLLSIINDLLDMSKISSGKLAIVPEEYDLAHILSDVYLLHSVKAAEKGLPFFMENDEFIPKMLIGDPLRIQQIITNLVSNSIKYTNVGTVKLKVDYREKNNDYIDLIITISDTGIGIKEEDIPYLFDTFARFDSEKNKHIEGTGVGLSIVKSLVDGMSGKIEVKSKYGEGTTFVVTLPQIVVTRDPIGKISSLKHSKKIEENNESQYTAPNAKVLAVDDNLMNLMVFGGLVKPLAIKVDTSSEGAAVLEMIKHKKYDIIFLDHMMPGMDGMEVLKHMKEDKTHLNQDTPVIVMTANCVAGAKEEYLNAGFDDYAGKPLQKDDLAATIRKYINPELIISNSAKEDAGNKKDDIFSISIKGVDWNKAYENTLDYDLLIEIVKTFYEMADNEMGLLDSYFEGISAGEKEEALGAYRIKVHAMKNSLALVGAGELSDNAKALEFASRDEDVKYIIDNHEIFKKEYLELAGQLQLAVTGSSSESKKLMTNDELMANLEMIKTAMDEFDLSALNEMSFALDAFTFETDTIDSYIKDIQEAIVVLDSDRIMQNIDELVKLIK